MGAALTANNISATYLDLLKISNSGVGLDGTLRAVGDGDGNDTGLSLSTTQVQINLADGVLQRPEIKDYSETISAHGATGAAETLDLAVANIHTITIDTAPVVLTFSNPPATGIAGSFTLIVTQEIGGSFTITWPTSVDWAGGVAPTLTSAAGAVDIFTFLTLDAGTIWYGFTAGLDMK